MKKEEKKRNRKEKKGEDEGKGLTSQQFGHWPREKKEPTR